jgi:uncharacterized lipoprotein YajG
MIVTQSRCRLTISAVLLAGMAVLAGCGTTPVSNTSVTEQTTTTTPPPMVSTTTSSTEQIEQPAHVARVHHKHVRYAMHHHAAPVTSETDTTTETTVTPMPATSTTVKSTETTTKGR